MGTEWRVPEEVKPDLCSESPTTTSQAQQAGTDLPGRGRRTLSRAVARLKHDPAETGRMDQRGTDWREGCFCF